jgi:hypothetical protein
MSKFSKAAVIPTVGGPAASQGSGSTGHGGYVGGDITSIIGGTAAVFGAITDLVRSIPSLVRYTRTGQVTRPETPEQQVRRAVGNRIAVVQEHQLYGHEWIYAGDGRTCRYPHCGAFESTAPVTVTATVVEPEPAALTSTRTDEYVVDVEIVRERESA